MGGRCWDNVEWGQEEEAQQVVDKANSVLMDAEKANECEEKATEFGDKFYSIHQNRFFNERNWLFTEFLDPAPGHQGVVRAFQSGQLTDISDVRNDNEHGDDSSIQEKLVIQSTALDQEVTDKKSGKGNITLDQVLTLDYWRLGVGPASQCPPSWK